MKCVQNNIRGLPLQEILVVHIPTKKNQRLRNKILKQLTETVFSGESPHTQVDADQATGTVPIIVPRMWWAKVLWLLNALPPCFQLIQSEQILCSLQKKAFGNQIFMNCV